MLCFICLCKGNVGIDIFKFHVVNFISSFESPRFYWFLLIKPTVINNNVYVFLTFVWFYFCIGIHLELVLLWGARYSRDLIFFLDCYSLILTPFKLNLWTYNVMSMYVGTYMCIYVLGFLFFRWALGRYCFHHFNSMVPFNSNFKRFFAISHIYIPEWLKITLLCFKQKITLGLWLGLYEIFRLIWRGMVFLQCWVFPQRNMLCLSIYSTHLLWPLVNLYRCLHIRPTNFLLSTF